MCICILLIRTVYIKWVRILYFKCYKHTIREWSIQIILTRVFKCSLRQIVCIEWPVYCDGSTLVFQKIYQLDFEFFEKLISFTITVLDSESMGNIILMLTWCLFFSVYIFKLMKLPRSLRKTPQSIGNMVTCSRKLFDWSIYENLIIFCVMFQKQKFWSAPNDLKFSHKIVIDNIHTWLKLQIINNFEIFYRILKFNFFFLR